MVAIISIQVLSLVIKIQTSLLSLVAGADYQRQEVRRMLIFCKKWRGGRLDQHPHVTKHWGFVCSGTNIEISAESIKL